MVRIAKPTTTMMISSMLLVFVLFIVQTVNAACNSTLQRFELSTVNDATCADGSPAVYYYDAPVTPSSTQFVIWLGDGALCGTPEQCQEEYLSKTPNTEGLCEEDGADGITTNLFTGADNEESKGRCFAVKLQHTSTWIQPNYTQIKGETILCRDDDYFADYHRIYLPVCSLDWFLGDGDDDPSATHSLWRGSRILDELFLELSGAPFNIQSASRVVLGGTGGGAVGLINNFMRIRHGPLNGVFNVLAVTDSGYLVNVERFANLSRVFMGPDEKAFKLDQDLRNRVAGWIGKAKMDQECQDLWGVGESSRCIYISEVLKQPLIQDEKVMVIQSQYDLTVLSQLDLLNQTLFTLYADNASYAQNAVNYVEGFGSEIRRKLEASAYYEGAADNLFFLSTSCGQYGYVVPSELQVIDRREADMGRAGQLSYQRDSAVWTSVKVSGLSIRDSIVQWVESDGTVRPQALNSGAQEFPDRNGVRSDRCGTFLCNESCMNTVIPFGLRTIWGPCSQRLVVAYCLIMLTAWWILFLIALSAVCMFRRRTSRYWSRVISEEEKEAKRDPEAETRYRDMAEEELIRDAFASARRVHLMVRNLSYWAPPRKSGRAYQILRDVSAAFPAGKVHAMMGPSGSGKSTLLDMVALTRDSGYFTGSHYVNGVDSYSKRAAFLREWLRHNVSYVRQQDNMFPYLTVREHLTHAAWLMLPEFMDSEAKLRRVWQVIKLMGLEKAADTICGDGGVEVEGGISGGQRRRVSVATQLLKLPACLVLDEPTSGLDATNALSLVKSLHTLAHRGGTNVIMTIHQPRREIFRFLDTLAILVGGRILFAGMPKEAFDHFEVSRRLNIGDEVLDQLGKAQLDSVLAYQRKYEKGPLGKRVEQDMASEVVLDFDSRLAVQLQYTLTTNALADGRWSWTESSSAPLLMYVLLSRTIKRGGFDLQKTVTISLLGGVLVGIVFLGANESYARHISMAYLSVATMTFLQGTFIGDRYWAEKFMYTYESEAGTARPWISFLASMFSRLVVASTTEAMAFALPVFFVGRMNNDNDQVRMYLLILVMCAVTTATQYLLVEIYFMKPDDKRTAALVNMALLSMSALFNGFIIQLNDLPIYLKWIPVIMLSYWSFVGLLLNDLEGFVIPCEASVLECAARSGDAVVKGLQYDNRDIFQCLFALLIMVGIFLLLSVVVFFYKWVSPIGQGLKRRTSPELKEAETLFLQRAKDIARQEGQGGNTLQTVLKDGKNLQKQGSQQKLTRNNSSDGGMTRANSAGSMARADSFGSQQDSSRKMVINPNPVMDREDSGKTMGSGENPPPLQTETSFQVTDDDEAPGVRTPVCTHEQGCIWPFLSRILLVCYYIVDFLAASTICNGQDSAVAEIDGAGQAFENVTDILGNLGGNFAFDSDSINVVFVLVTAVFLIGYLVQFIIQFLFLFPRDTNNRINPCTRIALLDILGAGFIAIDFILLFVLIGAGRGAQLQIYLLVAIRVIRGLRVMTFWYKISAFHELRVVAYLEYKLMLMGEYDPTAFGENLGNDIGDKEMDIKPPVPSRDTKPSISQTLLALNIQPSAPLRKPSDSQTSAAGSTNTTSFLRRAVKSIRAPQMSTEQRRVSLQRRVSIANKRISGRLQPLDPLAPGAAGSGTDSSASAHVSSSIGGPGSRPMPPPVAPRPPVLPPMLRVNVPGSSVEESPGSSATNARGRIMSMRNPLRPPGPAPPVPIRPPGLVPPPIAPRTNVNLSGFGIAPGALQMMQGRGTAYRARVDEPSMDEI